MSQSVAQGGAQKHDEQQGQNDDGQDGSLLFPQALSAP